MMNKHVLFLDAYFEPETVADTHLENDIISGLVDNGCTVNVICPVPTRGVTEDVKKKYRKIKHETWYGGSVNVTRFWAPQERKNPILRALRYFWCNIRSYQIASRFIEIDTIYCNSTPPTQGFLAACIKKRLTKKNKHSIHFVFNLQDIFPDSLVNTGLSKRESVIWEIGNRIANFTYRNADSIITITNRFKHNIVNKGVPEDKVTVVSNWIDLSMIQPISRNDNKIVDEFDLDPHKFIVLYAGNFGASQGADIIIDAAKKMTDYSDIHFVVFGGGPYFDEAKKKAAGVTNLSIYSLLPLNRVSEVYSLGDVSIIMCKPGTGGAGMPSKLWSIMACESPTIASFDLNSDLVDTIKDAQCGVCVEPGNVSLLCDAIIDQYTNKINGNINKCSFRKYVEKNADKKACVGKYCDVIMSR